MTQFTTELLNFLAQKQDIDEFFRTSLETAMNDLLQAELSAFLGYEPYDKLGYNSGNSRNGSYARKFETKYGTVQLSIPRDLVQLCFPLMDVEMTTWKRWLSNSIKPV